jgi:hypothetical protein
MGATRGKLLVVVALLIATAGAIGMTAWGVLRAQEDDSALRPIVIREGTPAPDITGDWPPPDLEEKAIDLAKNDPQVKVWVDGHRLGVFSVPGLADYKEAPCDDPMLLNCVEVTVYDYTRLGAVSAVVDIANESVVDRWLDDTASLDVFAVLPDVQAILEGDPEFHDAILAPGAAPHQVGDRDYGGKCGVGQGDHPCVLVAVRKPDDSAHWLKIDLALQEIVRAYEQSELEGP